MQNGLMRLQGSRYYLWKLVFGMRLFEASLTMKSAYHTSSLISGLTSLRLALLAILEWGLLLCHSLKFNLGYLSQGLAYHDGKCLCYGNARKPGYQHSTKQRSLMPFRHGTSPRRKQSMTEENALQSASKCSVGKENNGR